MIADKTILKLQELRRLSNEEINKERFDRDPAFRAQVTLESVEGEA